MYLIVEENPNCSADERVFPVSGEKRPVAALHLAPPGGGDAVWCDVAAVDENGAFGPAFSYRIEDSSDGTAWLIFGGAWGLRLRPQNSPTDWSINDQTQWGVPFLVLDSSGTSIRFG